MNKKTLAIIAVVVVVIAVVAVGVYLATQGDSGDNSPNPTPTPTVTPTPTGTSTTTPTATPSGTGGNVAGATSLKYSVSVTEGGQTQGYTYQAKNAGSNNIMLRIDFTDSSGEKTIYVINGVETKAWTFSNGAWEDVSAAYQTQFNIWNSLYQGYVTNLSTWTSGDWTYTSEGATVRIYDISVNPSIPDSVFQPT